MKIAAFDLEIAVQIPDNERDFFRHAPLGITCAGFGLSDQEDPTIFQGRPQMSPEACQEMVAHLQSLVEQGYAIVTWNGCGFDFRVLAQESGLWQECAELAMGHVDLMLLVTFQRGHYLSLQRAAEGAGLAGKLKSVTLNDGSVMRDMSGALAPKLWAQGEYEAVLAYLRDDVLQTFKLAQSVRENRCIQWTSGRGRPQHLFVDRLRTVSDCFSYPQPDTSWMRDPPTRAQFTAWMPQAER